MGAREHVRHATRSAGQDRVRRARPRTAALLAFLGTLLAAVGANAQPASAAPTVTYPDAISNISMVTADGSDGPLHKWDTVRIDADWSVPDGATAGDTFGMTMPAEFQRMGTGAFPLQDPSGVTLADCVIAAGGGADLVCTLTAAVEGLEHVGGTFWMSAQATQSTTNESVQFDVGTTVEIVDLPGEGGIIGGDETAPTTPYKFASASGSIPGDMIWTVGIPASYVTTGSFTVKDQLDLTQERHHYVHNLWLVQRPVQDGVYVGDWVAVDPSYYTVSYAADDYSFELTAAGLPTSGYDYRLQYVTEPDGVALTGDVFGNTADVGGTIESSTYTEESVGGGTGTGLRYTRFTLAKAVLGDQAAAASGATYTVRYSVKGSTDAPKTLTVQVGQPVRSDRAPLGSTFVIEEIDLPAIDGVRWGPWTLAGDGVTALGDGTYEVTPQTDAGVSLVLTNHADQAVIVPPPAGPAALADTGVEVAPIAAAGGLLLLLGTTLLLLRRRTEHDAA